MLALMRLWLLVIGFILRLELLEEFPASLVGLLVVARTVGINAVTSASVLLLMLRPSRVEVLYSHIFLILI